MEAVTLADEAKVNAAKTAFDALSDTEKAKVGADKQEKLTKLLAKIAELKKPTQVITPINNPAPVAGPGGGGGGGGGSTGTPVVTQSETTTEKNKETVTTRKTSNIFPNFVAKREKSVTSLTDSRLIDLQKQFRATTEITRNESLTRGEFLQILLDAAKVDISSIATDALKYTDVLKSSNTAKYIAFATQNGIVSGYENNTFRSENTISRAEAMKILVNTLGVKIADKNTQFKDVTTHNTLGKYIQTAFDNFLVN